MQHQRAVKEVSEAELVAQAWEEESKSGGTVKGGGLWRVEHDTARMLC